MQGAPQRAAAGSCGLMSTTSTPEPAEDHCQEPGASVGHGAEALAETKTSGSPLVGVTVMVSAAPASFTWKVK